MKLLAIILSLLISCHVQALPQPADPAAPESLYLKARYFVHPSALVDPNLTIQSTRKGPFQEKVLGFFDWLTSPLRGGQKVAQTPDTTNYIRCTFGWVFKPPIGATVRERLAFLRLSKRRFAN